MIFLGALRDRTLVAVLDSIEEFAESRFFRWKHSQQHGK
jgi:hypothetical protein